MLQETDSEDGTAASFQRVVFLSFRTRMRRVLGGIYGQSDQPRNERPAGVFLRSTQIPPKTQRVSVRNDLAQRPLFPVADHCLCVLPLSLSLSCPLTCRTWRTHKATVARRHRTLPLVCGRVGIPNSEFRIPNSPRIYRRSNSRLRTRPASSTNPVTAPSDPRWNSNVP